MKQFDFTKDPEKQGDDAITVGRTRKRKPDLLPRLVCLLIAFLLWIYLVNLNDTDVTSTVTLKLEIVGEEQLKNANMIFYGLEKNEVTVTLQGTQRDLKKYTKEDYRATIDVSNLTKSGRHTIPINIEVPNESKIIAHLDVKEQNVSVYTDILLSKEVPLIVVNGGLSGNPLHTKEIVQNVDQVQITGPASMLEKIYSVRYTVTGDFYTSRDFLGVALEFYDEKNDAVSFEPGTVTYSTADVKISVRVRETRLIDVLVKVEEADQNLIAIAEPAKVAVKCDPQMQPFEYTVILSEGHAGQVQEKILLAESLPEGVTFEGDAPTVKIRFEDAVAEVETEAVAAPIAETESEPVSE